MSDKKSLTMRDIAKAAGVSAATVSLVLNGKGEISGATRAKVLDVVADLNYVPRPAKVRAPDSANDTLRFLKIAKHGHTVNRDHSHFISDYIDGMSQEAMRRGYTLEVVSHEREAIQGLVQSLAGTGIKGVVALGTELSEADIRLLLATGIPTVFIDTFHEVIETNFVNMNNEDAVYKVLSRFKSQGFRDIGFVASPVETTNFRLRHDAFVKNMGRLDLPIHEENTLWVESTFDGAYEATLRHLISGGKLAECYFCTNDIIAYGFIKALREHGIRIPADVSIIGFDNLPMSGTMDPPLTTIDVSKRKIGYLAITILDDLINASEWQPSVKILVGADLVVRSSDRHAKRRRDASASPAAKAPPPWTAASD
jgi:LacI family transcriptional regulator